MIRSAAEIQRKQVAAEAGELTPDTGEDETAPPRGANEGTEKNGD
jgi:hypothetical protein